MNDLVPLHFGDADIRMVMLDGTPWWVLIDVARAIGVRNHRNIAARLWDWQKDAVQILDAIRRPQTTVVINESGIYPLILASKKPEAERFAKWLFMEVLPSIRIWGQYPPPQFSLDDPDRAQTTQTTPQQRFMAECDRLAAQHNVTVSTLLDRIVTPQQRRAIELGHGPIASLLHKDRRWEMFLGIGMDLQYVLHGVWGQTPQERRVVAQMRAAQSEYRLPSPPDQMLLDSVG